jgi:glycosyltransferase involved in cell wall biosynthesis
MGFQPHHLALFIKSMSGGGAERFIVNLANEWAADGHRVDVVLAHRRGPLLDEIEDRVNVVDLEARRSITSFPALARLPRELPHLLRPSVLADLPNVFGAIGPLERYLRHARPHALLSALNFGNIAAAWAHRLAGVPTRLVLSEHNPLSIRIEHAQKARKRELPRMVGHFYPWADAITACSAGVADDLAATACLPRDLITTVYNPVVHSAMLEKAKEEPDHPWLAPGEPPVILGVGRLRPQKDFATLIRAFAALRRRRTARLLILGVGPEQDRLESLIRELGLEGDAELAGFRPNPLAYMSRAGLVALSSVWEGLPTVLIEALACGCPVVSTDCRSGPSEILDAGRYGRLAPVGDAHALADAMERTLAEPPCAQRLQERSSDFSTARAAHGYLELLLGEGAQA